MERIYALRQKLPAEVLVGGNAVWSRYRQYPVFGLRWLAGRSLLFCSVIAVVACFIGLGTLAVMHEPGVAVKVGLTEFLPVDGAFYLYADVSKFNPDSFEFAKEMLQQAHVAATPGMDFDPFHGKSFVRFSYSRSTQEITEAVARITRWLSKG